jgi:hypothetical protein
MRGGFRSPLVQRALELHGIAPDLFRGDRQLLVTTGDYDRRSQCMTQEVEGLAEGVARAFGVVLGPEESKERITAKKAARGGKCEIAEKRHAPGLGEYRPERCTVGGNHLQGAQRAQLDHAGSGQWSVTRTGDAQEGSRVTGLS